MKSRLVPLALGLVASSAWAADGLAAPPDETVWPQWQVRLTLHPTSLAPISLTGNAGTAPRQSLRTGAVLGDFYFDTPGLRPASTVGGLRASGGLLMGSGGLSSTPVKSASAGSRLGLAVQGGSSFGEAGGDAASPLPYIGVGYTGLSAAAGWGVTADLGLVTENLWPGAGRSGHALLGVQGMDNSLRELRLSPVLQLGLRYSF